MCFGYTTRDVAAKVGVSYQTLNNWLNRPFFPNAQAREPRKESQLSLDGGRICPLDRAGSDCSSDRNPVCCRRLIIAMNQSERPGLQSGDRSTKRSPQRPLRLVRCATAG